MEAHREPNQWEWDFIEQNGCGFWACLLSNLQICGAFRVADKLALQYIRTRQINSCIVQTRLKGHDNSVHINYYWSNKKIWPFILHMTRAGPQQCVRSGRNEDNARLEYPTILGAMFKSLSLRISPQVFKCRRPLIPQLVFRPISLVALSLITA